MKKLSLLLLIFLTSVGMMLAQRMVSGTITDSGGEALIGANVLVKGSDAGTITDVFGHYELNVPDGFNTLVISYTGYTTQEMALTGSNTMDIVLSEGVLLGDVVVTALGIKRDKKSLGYATQEVKGDVLSQTKTENIVNNLSGRVAGVQIKTNNNFGGSSNVIIRGNSSLTGNNQALFVVDGVVISNSNNNLSSQKGGGTGYDYGNGASDINPEDIESVNVLKGAAASALYGSRASNGVVLITTKKGTKNKGLGITINSGFEVGNIDKSTFLTYQDKYGAGYGKYYGSTGDFYDYDVDGDGVDDFVVPTTEDGSYGGKFDPNLDVYHWDSFVPESPNFGKKYPYVAAKHTPVDFFEQSSTLSNGIAFTGGNDKGAFRLGYTNFVNNGMLPNSKLTKNSFSLNSSYNLTDKLTASVNANYVIQGTVGRNSTGYSDNLMSQFRQWWETNVDILDQKSIYEETGRNETWNGLSPQTGNRFPIFWDNPYWTRYQNFQSDDRNRLMGSASLSYDINSWLNVLGKVGIDSYKELREERRAVGSVASRFGITRNEQGSGYQRMDIDFRETNIDLMLTADKDLTDDINIKALLGFNKRDESYESVRASTQGGLVVPGLYSLGNSVSANPFPVEALRPKEVHGYYGSVSFGYQDFLFLDITDRYDISSALPVENNAYNYYGISTGLLFSKLLLTPAISYGKLRASYAEVGNDLPALNVYDVYPKNDNFGTTGLFSVSSTKRNSELLPERMKSLEAGLEMKFLDNRFGFDFSIYKTNTTNQLMPVSVSRASGYSRKWVNAGEIQNQGVELALFLTPFKTESFSWTSDFNWTRNRNLVVSLADGVDNLQLNSYQGNVSINATVGQPYGTIRGFGFKFDDKGNKVIGDHGYYLSESDQIIGNSNPDWTGGWNNTFTYKNLSFNFLIDISKGGDVYSLDMHYGRGTGLPVETAALNDLGNPVRDPVTDDDKSGGILNEGVLEDGTPNTKRVRADYYGGAFYWGNSGRNPGAITVYDASYTKLREVGLSYKLPDNLFGLLRTSTISVTGRNLWIISKNLPYADPESGLGAGNAQGYVVGSYPTLRTYGVNLKIGF